MKYTIPARVTEYNGTRFRSRLEARWAAFFDLIGWTWTYEPYELEGWDPDFLIHGESPLLIEVKPCNTTRELIEVCDQKVKASKPQNAVLLCGASPSIVVLGQDEWGEDDTLEWEHESFSGPSTWGWCERGRGWAVSYEVGLWSGYPYGCDGKGCCRSSVTDTAGILEQLWREAGNLTQWRRTS